MQTLPLPISVRASVPLGLACAALGCERFDDHGIDLDPPCAQEVASLRPRDGDEGLWLATSVSAILRCPAPTAVVQLWDGEGEPILGRLEHLHADRFARFQPNDLLPPDSTVEARLDTPEGYRTWSFRTGTVALPLGGAPPLGSWSLRIADAALNSPVDPDGTLLEALAEQWTPLVSVVESEPAVLRLGARGGRNPQSAQDGAVATVDADATWDDPSLGPAFPGGRWALGSVVLSDAAMRLDLGGEAAFARIQGRIDPALLGEPWSSLPANSDCANGPCLLIELDAVPAEPWPGTVQAVP